MKEAEGQYMETVDAAARRAERERNLLGIPPDQHVGIGGSATRGHTVEFRKLNAEEAALVDFNPDGSPYLKSPGPALFFARTGYEAYREKGESSTYDGKRMPTWEELKSLPHGERTRALWQAGATAILSAAGITIR